ncbi:helix-turn-helix domain-containing protein [Tabrizicola sp.]|uniref:helix-turn-helix domain-containing protein n=1 Tax=Tabrizicola sp. TaxID=2005166 RepID=UPI002FDE92AF
MGGGTDFTRNLGLLCSYQRSIAEICRKLGFNRQQFNKYLAGSVMPSRRNMRRICDFFGVTESELLLPHDEFRHLVVLRPAGPVAEALPSAVTRFQSASRLLPERYLGNYLLYSPSFAMPGLFTVSFVRMSLQGGMAVWKNIEYLRRHDRNGRIQQISKYIGIVAEVGDRLNVLQEEELRHEVVNQTILYPAYGNPVRRLYGMHLSLTDMHRRTPAASRVVLDRIEGTLHLRRVLRRCGQYPADQIPYDIRELLGALSPFDRPILEASPG